MNANDSSTYLDECIANRTSSCSFHAECLKMPGSFTCVCNSGFASDGLNCTGAYHQHFAQPCQVATVETNFTLVIRQHVVLNCSLRLKSSAVSRCSTQSRVCMCIEELRSTQTVTETPHLCVCSFRSSINQMTSSTSNPTMLSNI